MNHPDKLKQLRQRALVVKDHNTSEKYIPFPTNIQEELGLYQIELELQNEDLREVEVEREKILNKYLNLYNLAPAGYFTIGSSGLITEVNQLGANLLGLDKNSLINKCFARYVAPESQLIFSAFLTIAFTDCSLKKCEVKLLNRGGSLFYAELKGSISDHVAPDDRELLVIVTNISDRKEAERNNHFNQKKLTSTDRSNSMHELASVIAHEINNPLAVILNYVQGCIRRLETGNVNNQDILYALKEAVKQSSRVSEIILRLKNFKNQGVLTLEVISIDAIIKEIITLINYELNGFNVKITYLSSPMPNVEVDKIHIQQVILNLARNAVEAMRDADTRDPHLIIEPNRVNLHEMEVSIVDNGPGLPDDSIHQLFDPHYTTKNYGVGLGLAVSQSIIKAHGGELIAKSNLLGGACFTFTLKLAQT